MLNFFTRKLLIKAIKRTCINELGVYESGIEDLIQEIMKDQNIDEDQLQKENLSLRRDYLNAVAASMFKSLSTNNPSFFARYKLALSFPSMTGLSEVINADYLSCYGFSAGITFAFCYFAMTNEKVTSVKLCRTISMLSHFQKNLMDSVLHKFAEQYERG